MNAIALAIVMLGVQSAFGQAGARVEAELTPDTARIGERVALIVRVSEAPADAEVVFPELPDTGALSALGPPVRPLSDRPAIRWSARYDLAAWQVGDLPLPPAEVRVLAGGAELRIPLPELTLHVTSVLPAGADPDTLAWKPPADVVGGNWSLREQLAGAALALLLLSAASIYLRRRGARQPIARVPPRPPRERALAALAALEASGLADAGEIKGFYSALSHIVRAFLAETEGDWGLDLTTQELVAAAAVDGIRPGEVAALSALLAGADMVKFARWRPTPKDAAQTLAEARRWISEFERAAPQREPQGTPEPPAEAADWTLDGEELAEMERLFGTEAAEPADASGLAPEET